jgi:hypothetical protein
LDAARIKGNERRARRLKARAIDLAPLIIGLRERGMSLAKGELTRLRVRTTSGQTIWTESTIRRLLIRSADQFPDRKNGTSQNNAMNDLGQRVFFGQGCRSFFAA